MLDDVIIIYQKSMFVLTDLQKLLRIKKITFYLLIISNMSIYRIIDKWTELRIWVNIKAEEIDKNGWINFTIPKKHIIKENKNNLFDNLNNF